MTVEDVATYLRGDPHLSAVAATTLGHQLLKPSFFNILKEAYSRRPSDKTFEAWFSDDVLEVVLSLCKHNDNGVATEAVYAVGWIAKGLPPDSVYEARCLNHLVGLQTIKNEELQCTIGEALSFGLSKDSIPNDLVMISNFRCLRNVDIDFASLPPPPSSNAHRGTVDDLLKGLTHSRSENRSACGSHLVALMTYCPKHPAILDRLESAQRSFLGLLGDRNGLTQEMASRGVSLVYALGDENTKSKLLNGLTSVLRDPTKKGSTVKVDGETEVFAEGELGTAPGGGQLTTYKELCSLASDMGQPDLLYKFMDIANHRTALQSRRGAAVGFVHIAEMAGEDLKPYLPSLLPRIYRLKFDPNPSVQETMNNIWRSLVLEDMTSIDVDIVKELLNEIGSRLWRHRESSCRGLIDWLQGKQWPRIRRHLEEIWTKAFRAADDIKESVRSAGVDLLKTLKRTTLRFADPHVSEASVIEDVVGIVLPVLLNTLRHPTAASVVAVAFSTLSTLAGSCPPERLRPHLGLLVPTLLESHSSLESGVLDELQLHLAGSGIDAEQFERVRVQGASQSPIHNILDRCVRIVDKRTLDEGDLVSHLKDLIRSGVGLNTRIATLRFVKQMVTQLGHDGAQHAARFLGIMLSKSLSGESSQTMKKAYASTIGALCNVISLKATSKVIDACSNSFRSDGSDRQMVAFIFLELHRQAPDHFSAYATDIVPIAFVHRFEAGAMEMWETVLEEGMGSENGAVRLYHREIVDEVGRALTTSKWSARAAGAEAVGRMFEVNAEVMASHGEAVMKLLMAQLTGRIWDGQEAVLKAISSVCQHASVVVECDAMEIVDGLLQACKKGKKTYRQAALEALSKTVLQFNQRQDVYDHVVPFLLSAMNDIEQLASIDDQKEAEEKLPLTALLDCLASISCGSNPSAPIRRHAESLTVFASVLSSVHPWHLKLSALESLIKYFEGVQPDASSQKDQFTALISGVLVCMEEQKYEKLRLKSLDALVVLYPCIKPEHGVVDRLREKRESERSLAVQQSLDALIQRLNS